MQAYLHFGGAFCGAPEGPFQTMSVEHKVKAPKAAHCKEPFSTPSPYMVLLHSRWRRVWLHWRGGRGWTYYIGPATKPIATVSLEA